MSKMERQRRKIITIDDGAGFWTQFPLNCTADDRYAAASAVVSWMRHKNGADALQMLLLHLLCSSSVL